MIHSGRARVVKGSDLKSDGISRIGSNPVDRDFGHTQTDLERGRLQGGGGHTVSRRTTGHGCMQGCAGVLPMWPVQEVLAPLYVMYGEGHRRSQVPFHLATFPKQTQR